MADDVVVFNRPELATEAFPMMADIRRRGKLCDVTLKVGEQRLTAHRIVLASTIPYFHAMFTNDMVESKQDEITMQGIEPSALEALVNFAYNGRLQLDTVNVQALLVGASFLHMQVVKQACCDFLKNRLHPHNVLGIRAFADQYMCLDLVADCNTYIEQHFVETSRSDEFLLMTSEELEALMRNDELHVCNEEQVFEALLTWVKGDAENHKDHLPSLLKHVRLPLLSAQYLTDRVGQEELVKVSLECRDLLDEAKDYHLLPERRAHLTTFSTVPRISSEVSGIIFAVGGLTSSGDSISTVEFYEPKHTGAKWRVGEAMKTLRSRVGIAVLAGRLYAIGGYDGHERLNTVEMYDPTTRQWTLVTPMICRRSALGAAALDGRLYVCGGYDGVSSLQSVESYDTAARRWSMVASMSRSRSAAGVAVLEGHLYALGGHDGLSIFNTVERFSSLSNKWVAVRPMLTKRCRLGVAALHGKLYVAGGYDGNVFLRSVEVYDPAEDSWTQAPPMNVKRSRVALVANNGKLWAIGGYDGVSNLSSMETFSPDTGTWSFASSMCAHEGGVGVGVVPTASPREAKRE